MKHSAKGAAKLARQRERQARRVRAATTAPSPVTANAPVPAAAVPADPAVATPAEASPAKGPAPAGHVNLQATLRPAVATAARGGPARHRLAQLPYALVLAAVVLGLALMQGGGQAVRGGTLVIAGALLAGSLTRLVLPPGRAGLLGSRRRLVDVAFLTALGVGLLIAGLIVKVPG